MFVLLERGGIFSRRFSFFGGGLAGNISDTEDILDRVLCFVWERLKRGFGPQMRSQFQSSAEVCTCCCSNVNEANESESAYGVTGVRLCENARIARCRRLGKCENARSEWLHQPWCSLCRMWEASSCTFASAACCARRCSMISYSADAACGARRERFGVR